MTSRKAVTGYKRRFRTLIGQNVTIDDVNCPHTTEVMPCDKPQYVHTNMNIMEQTHYIKNLF